MRHVLQKIVVKWRSINYIAISLFSVFVASIGVEAAIATTTDYDALRGGYPAYAQDCVATASAGASGGDLDSFLKVLAYQESGGDITAVSNTGARGKYQYIDSTWQNSTREFYPPGQQYSRADQAPEEVQDAVAFFEYSHKFKELGNDIFKLAVSHFYPLANSEPEHLDIVPTGNVLTPREYAEKLQEKMNTEGPWSNIPLTYKSAPDFEQIAEEQGVDLSSPASGSGLQYKAVGNIPVEGLEVGASVYGGTFTGNAWEATNDIQNPGGNNDDPGIGNRDNPLPGTSSYAELSIDAGSRDFNALGGLPDGTKLAITYNGSTVVAEKADVGSGGGDVNGKPRAIDLWWEVARLLKFEGGLDVVTVHGVADDTPLTPVGGDAMTEGPGLDTACNQECTPGGVIVLDPGHSGEDRQGEEQDETTGLFIGDSSNPEEREAVWETTQIVKENLEEDGYNVVVTKEKEDSYVNLKRRAEIANQANAQLAVSIHFDGAWDFSDDGMRLVTPQEVGQYRENEEGERTTFDNAEIAEKSQEFAEIFVEERSKAEGGQAQIKALNFDQRPGLSPGNIPIVQLFSQVPWIYNEVGGQNFDAEKYAEGLTAAIRRSAAGGDECAGAFAGDIVRTAISFAWPTRSEALSKPPTPAYAAALREFGGRSDGKDCGLFVSSVMRASGVDPDYPHMGTFIMEPYVRDSPKYRVTDDIRSTSQVKPGDILIVNAGDGAGANGHIVIFIGEQDNGSNKADASLNSRTGGLGVFDPLGDSRGLYLAATLIQSDNADTSTTDLLRDSNDNVIPPQL